MFAAIALTLLLAGSEALRGRSSIIDLNVNTDDGSYTITVSGSKWFRSGPTSVHANGAWMTTEDGSLKLMNHSNYTGTDFWGPFNAIELEWQGKSGITFLTSFRTYANFPIISFVQHYPSGAEKTQAPSADEIMSRFPSVVIEGEKGQFGVMTYFGGNFAVSSGTSIMDWTSAASLPGGGDGGPVTVFDKDMQNAVIMSPASQFMAASQSSWTGMDKKSNYLGFGLLGKAVEIPKGFEYETVFYAGSGVNDAYTGWGRLMRERYGKTDAFREADFSNNYIGYWTDNGACYHYYKGEVNYEQTMLQVYETAEQKNIPFRYLQLDSWWYFKGKHGGVKNWTAMPEVFPHGLPYLHNRTGWPLFAHNRFWSPETDYAKQNGGQFDFIVEESASLPVTQDFWDFLLGTAKRDWGLFVYEQDWLLTVFGKLKALQENVTLGRTWLLQMGQAAQRHGLTIQYCMPYPRHLLQSLEIPSVTQTQVSHDYHANTSQWEIGYQAIFAEALGIAPFKDTFYTFPHQPMCSDKTEEMYPRLEAFSAVYSTGPVGPGDRYNLTDRAIVMQTCTEDGRILKPTKPMRAINAMFTQAAFETEALNGIVWTTHTRIGNLQWHHIFSAEMTSVFNFTPDYLLDLPQVRSDRGRLFSEQLWVSYPHNMTSPPQPFDASHPVKLPECGNWDFGLYHVAPVFPNGWVLLGEMTKLVAISEERIQSVTETETSINVQLIGNVNEKVTMSFWMPTSLNGKGKVIELTCIVLSSGFVTMAVPDNTCM